MGRASAAAAIRRASPTGSSTWTRPRAAGGSRRSACASARRRASRAATAICCWPARPARSAVATRVLEHFLEPRQEPDDPFYRDETYTKEFFAAVKQFNTRVIDDPCYAALLGAYGTSFLYPSGSRSVKRQLDSGAVKHVLEHPSQIRAIPHNSILQQLGVLANTIGGLGQAIAKDPDRFQDLYRTSARFRRLMVVVEHAFKFTDLHVVRAYLDLFDPAFWLQRADTLRDRAARAEARRIADYVEHLALFDRLMRIFRVLQRDYMQLASALRAHRRLTRETGDQPIAVDQATRDNLHMLHALRIALIERIMHRAVNIPDFSDRHGVTHDGLVVAVMQLEIEPALQMLGSIFPMIEEAQPDLDYGEPATYAEDSAQAYGQEHATIFRPLAADYDHVRRIGSAVIHHLGAIG